MARSRHVMVSPTRALPVSRVAAATAAVSLIGYLVVRWFTRPTMIDLIVYRAEGEALRVGDPLYGPLPVPHHLKATYPPAAALLFEPVAATPLSLAMVIVTIANLALVGVVCLQSCRLVGIAPERRATAALYLAAASLWFEPVFTTLRYGQVNLALLALVLLDFTVLRESRWCGFGTGLAAGLKVTPGIFVLYLLCTRRYRQAAVAVATFLATIVVGALQVPEGSKRYWTSLLFDSSRVGRVWNPVNQSVSGWITRLQHQTQTTSLGLLAAGVVLVAGIAVATFAHGRLGDAWGLPAAAVTGLLAAPIAWSHHWVWCIPVAALLWQWKRPAVALMLVFCSFAVWYVPHGLRVHLAGWDAFGSGYYVLFGLVLLALTVVAARAPFRPVVVGGPPAPAD